MLCLVAGPLGSETETTLSVQNLNLFSLNSEKYGAANHAMGIEAYFPAKTNRK